MQQWLASLVFIRAEKAVATFLLHSGSWSLPTLVVLSLSKIHDRDWSYMRHVICINNQCCPMHQHPGATFMLSGATVPGNITREHDAILGRFKYLFCAAIVDFASVDVTVVSSLKRFKTFSFVFYIL